MALEVAEGAVVGHHLEAVAERLEPAPGAVAAVARARRPARPASPRARPAAGCAAARGPRPRTPRPPRTAAPPAARPRSPSHRQQPHRRPGLLVAAGAVEPEPRGPALGGLRALLEVGDPLAAALGPLHARHEARHHRLQLARGSCRRSRAPRAAARRTGAAAAARRPGRWRRSPRARARPPAAARAAGRAPSRGSSARGPPRARRRPRGKRSAAHASTRGSDSRVGVEQEVHRRLVLGPELGVAPVAVAEPLRDRRVVGDVARGLLEVGGQPAALEQLRHHVRDPLAGDVRAAELRHRVVPVAEEDALVELAGALALLAVERPRRLGVRRRTRRGRAAAACPGSASSGRTARPSPSRAGSRARRRAGRGW